MIVLRRETVTGHCAVGPALADGAVLHQVGDREVPAFDPYGASLGEVVVDDDAGVGGYDCFGLGFCVSACDVGLEGGRTGSSCW